MIDFFWVAIAAVFLLIAWTLIARAHPDDADKSDDLGSRGGH